MRLSLLDGNNGMMGSWISITLKKVGGESTCGVLEAEVQEFFASCLREEIFKRSVPELKEVVLRFDIHYSTITIFHVDLCSELFFPCFRGSPNSILTNNV